MSLQQQQQQPRGSVVRSKSVRLGRRRLQQQELVRLVVLALANVLFLLLKLRGKI